MTEAQAKAAASILRRHGEHDAADHMEQIAETARRQHFDEIAARCYDDPDFALAYEEDAREFRS